MFYEENPIQMPHSVLNMYYFLLIGVLGALVWLFEVILRTNKKWALAVILCPPLCLVFIFKYWEEARAASIFLVLCITLNFFAGFFSGYPFTEQLIRQLQWIFLWPIGVIHLILKHAPEWLTI